MAHELADRASRRPLELRPLRALRYDPARVGNLWDVTAPPYDVLDADTVAALLQHPYNVVRLIVPRRRAGDVSPYAGVAHLLQSWRESGALRVDPDPGLYVYEYTDDATVVRGLVGGVGVYDPAENVVLPHEEVMAQPVDDRLALMLATEANLEPILLLYDGGGAASAVVASVCQRPALATARTPEGCTHQLWQITDRGELATVAADLAPRQALIADGHHRYATYRRLRREHPDLPGADVGLALLVDQTDHPLKVGAIHRSVAGLRLEDVRRSAQWTLLAHPDRASAVSAQPPTAFVVTDGSSWFTATLTGGPATPAEEIASLHETLLTAWAVPEGAVGYFHDADAAVRAASAADGIAILTRASSVAEVMAAARAGARMPRKSTSFAPKPRMGLLMRALRAE